MTNIVALRIESARTPAAGYIAGMIAPPGARGSHCAMRASRLLHLALLPLALLLGSCAHIVLYSDPNGPRYEGSFPARPDAEPGLRIVTFNIQYARHIHLAAVLLRDD